MSPLASSGSLQEGRTLGTKTAATTTSPRFSDSFGTALDADPGYGLNDSLKKRQLGSAGVTYTRVAGTPAKAPAPRPWYSQVNHVNHPGALSFWLGTSAVRMDAPVIAGSDGTVGVQALVDPINGDTASNNWSSLVLSSTPSSTGYVTSKDVTLGVLVRSNGSIQVFQGGTQVLSRAGFAQPDSAGKFELAASFTPGGKTAKITVNGSSVAITTPAALPARSTLFMGAYLNATGQTSTLSNLAASDVDRTSLTLSASSSLQYYGYYAARLTGVSHLPEVAGRSNLNWVNISDVDGYHPEVLDGCADQACVINTGNEFFSCNSAGMSCHLYPNYAERWNELAAAARPYLNKIAAFYVQDEPQFHGATAAQISTSAQLIKTTFPDKKVMMVEAGPKVTPSLTIPTSVDWVGFDWYCRPFSDIQKTLTTLKELLPTTSTQKIFLLPENAPLAECGGIAGHATDANIATLQSSYLSLAEHTPRVIGLLNFGFWTSSSWTKGKGASDLPLTVNADERAAARILAANQ